MSRSGLSEFEVVIVVARKGSFRAAAIELGMSPSSLSHVICLSVCPFEGKIINANNGEYIGLVSITAANHPQQRVIAHRHHQTIGKSCGRSAT